MNKQEFIAKVADKASVTKKDAEKIWNAGLETITAALKKKDKLTFVGFGTFDVSERAAREGRNPQTGKPIKIPKTWAVRFKAGKALKEAVN